MNSDLSAHAIYIHCFCHRLQLTSIKAAPYVNEIIILGWETMTHSNSGSNISEGDKDVFWKHDKRLEVFFKFHPKRRGFKGHPGCSWFSRAEDREAL